MATHDHDAPVTTTEVNGEGELYAAGINIQPDGDVNHTGRWGGYVSEFTVSVDRELTIGMTPEQLASQQRIADQCLRLRLIQRPVSVAAAQWPRSVSG